MSERGDVEVLVPVSRPPVNRADKSEVFTAAVREARRLVAPYGGRVLAMTRVTRSETAVGELALKFRFLVEAPERVLERP